MARKTKDCPNCGLNQTRLRDECRNCGFDLSDVPPAYH